MAWRAREAALPDASALTRRVRDARAALARLDRELAQVEAEVVRLAATGAGPPDA